MTRTLSYGARSICDWGFNWEPLASRLHAARLLMFYKIHYGFVATPMLRHQPVHMRVKKTLWLTTSHRHHVTITFILSLPPALFVTGTFSLKRSSGPLPLRYSGVWFRITQSVSWYSTDNCCRESRPYHEKPLFSFSCFLLLSLLSFVAPLVCFCCSLHSRPSITWPVYNILKLSRNLEEECRTDCRRSWCRLELIHNPAT